MKPTMRISSPPTLSPLEARNVEALEARNVEPEKPENMRLAWAARGCVSLNNWNPPAAWFV